MRLFIFPAVCQGSKRSGAGRALTERQVLLGLKGPNLSRGFSSQSGFRLHPNAPIGGPDFRCQAGGKTWRRPQALHQTLDIGRISQPILGGKPGALFTSRSCWISFSRPTALAIGIYCIEQRLLWPVSPVDTEIKIREGRSPKLSLGEASQVTGNLLKLQ